MPAAQVERIRAGTETCVTVQLAEAAQLADLGPAWIDLLARADAPNVFMDPALVCSAAETNPKLRIGALLAWRSADRNQQLAGLWAFAVGRARKSVLPIDLLNIAPLPYWPLATPVIDRNVLDGTLDAMLDCIADEPSLPNIVALDSMGEGATMEALTRVLARRNSAPLLFEQFKRPKLASALD